MRKCSVSATKKFYDKNHTDIEIIRFIDLRSPHVRKIVSNLFEEQKENAEPVTSFLATPPQIAILLEMKQNQEKHHKNDRFRHTFLCLNRIEMKPFCNIPNNQSPVI